MTQSAPQNETPDTIVSPESIHPALEALLEKACEIWGRNPQDFQKLPQSAESPAMQMFTTIHAIQDFIETHSNDFSEHPSSLSVNNILTKLPATKYEAYFYPLENLTLGHQGLFGESTNGPLMLRQDFELASHGYFNHDTFTDSLIDNVERWHFGLSQLGLSRGTFPGLEGQFMDETCKEALPRAAGFLRQWVKESPGLEAEKKQEITGLLDTFNAQFEPIARFFEEAEALLMEAGIDPEKDYRVQEQWRQEADAAEERQKEWEDNGCEGEAPPPIPEKPARAYLDAPRSETIALPPAPSRLPG